MKKFALAIVSAAALLAGGMATQASAAPVTVTYTGTVTVDSLTTFDPTNQWVTITGSNVGSAATFGVTWDPSLATDASAPGLGQVLGGTDYSAAPPGSGFAQVGNLTFSILDPYEVIGVQAVDYGGSLNAIVHIASASSTSYDPNTGLTTFSEVTGQGQIENSSGIPGLTTDLSAPFSYNPQPGDTAQGMVQIINYVEYGDSQSYLSYSQETFVFDIANVTETPTVTSDVPEPATWAMMLIGFGGIGVMTRRNRVPARA